VRHAIDGDDRRAPAAGGENAVRGQGARNGFRIVLPQGRSCPVRSPLRSAPASHLPTARVSAKTVPDAVHLEHPWRARHRADQGDEIPEESRKGVPEPGPFQLESACGPDGRRWRAMGIASGRNGTINRRSTSSRHAAVMYRASPLWDVRRAHSFSPCQTRIPGRNPIPTTGHTFPVGISHCRIFTWRSSRNASAGRGTPARTSGAHAPAVPPGCTSPVPPPRGDAR